jgi:hypothetical protein
MSEDDVTAKLRELAEQSRRDINLGFGEMGNRVNNPTELDVFLFAGARRALSFASAITLLCQSGYTEEAAILTRSLIELAVNMRWIQFADTDKRLEAFFHDFKKRKVGEAWAKDLRKRMIEIGMHEYYYNWTIKFLSGIVHTNASSLVYDGVLVEAAGSKLSESAVLVLAVQMMGHVLYALNERYPNHFSGYDELWEYINTVESIPEHPADLITENGQA